MRIATIMAFVADPQAAARFWSEALDAPLAEPQLVDAGEIELFFHAADPERNPQGGTVAYFAVADFDAVRERLLRAGCLETAA